MTRISKTTALQLMIHLWQYFLEDDLDAFRRFLADATFYVGPKPHKGLGSHASNKGASSALPSTSPRNTIVKGRKSAENTSKASRTSTKQDERLNQVNLTRADVNATDAYGRTLLHRAASSTSPNALGFVEALLQIPFIDLYVQDLESGWTALHRALYHGHIGIAQALMLRDTNDPMNYTANVPHHCPGGLIRIKDHEGNSPFEVFTLTIASRDLQHSTAAIPTLSIEDTGSVNSADADDPNFANRASSSPHKPRVNLSGDEVFAFGSNKNLNLGLGDEDDRQFPEQVTLIRPKQLLHRLHIDAQARGCRESESQDLSLRQIMAEATSTLPAVVKYQPIVILDVVMAKLHTAVLTNDPESNLYVCGFGPGGRLGTGDESTRFSYVCLQAGGLSKKHVVVVALGQDHSVAVCEQGEVFTWGSNRFGQLGYILPQSSSTVKENPMQLTPRQLFGSMKKEMIIGAAASSLHSVIFTCSALYTFGKNEGQLGLMDADARSLEMQMVPRRVGVSILQSSVLMVSAIDRATTILLESHEVVVLTHFGWTKVVFQLEGFTNQVLNGSRATRYNTAGNFISMITSGGNTICAMSTFGEVFTVDVSNQPDSLDTNQSTTNPFKARNALPHPSKLWSIRKSHMAARDVAVGQGGSIILCTVSGSVWRKENRAKIKLPNAKGNAARLRDYKFTRVPNLNRAVGVRSNAYGAFTAIRKDCAVTRQQIIVDPQALWNAVFKMLPFAELANVADEEDSDTENPKPRFWTPVTGVSSPVHVKQAILLSADIETQMRELMSKYEALAESQYDLWITSTVSDIRIPAHSFLVKARSPLLRQALAEFQKSYYFSIPDIISIEYGADGHINLIFQGADFFTILNYVFYLYTENIIDVWHHTQRKIHLAPRYRLVRAELMKIGGSFDMGCLERAARLMTEPARCLHLDMELAFKDPSFFTDADVRIRLANNLEVPAHSIFLSRRCPFFEGLFHGRAGGSWLASRRNQAEEVSDLVSVDLKHVDRRIFRMVLRHIYADTGEELFDDVVTADLDEFIDLIIEVMAVSNELMLDRLTQVCQRVLGQHVTTKNICQLLNAVAPCSVDEFKHAGLEYICLNLETMLEHRLLEELDGDLLMELDGIVQENQLACLPFAKSGGAQAKLFEQHPELVAKVEQGKQRTIDSLRLRSRLLESEDRIQSAQKSRAEELERASLTSLSPLTRPSLPIDRQSPEALPAPKFKSHCSEMLFEMDEEQPIDGLTDSSVMVSTLDDKRMEDEAPLNSASPISRQQCGLHRRCNIIDSKTEGPVASSSGSLLRKQPSSDSVSGKRPDTTSDLSTGADTYSKAWHGPLPGSAKTNFKDIMAQASSSRTSNLTLAISHRDTQLGKAPQRLSQRERKKIQHQQSQEKVFSPSDKSVTRYESPLAPTSPRSPWQMIRNASEPLSHQTQSPDSSPRPAMTMRQTVAGCSALHKEYTSIESKPSVVNASTTSSGQSFNSKPQIQSVRHTPATPNTSGSPLGAYHSMADILEQQQGEKRAFKEAAAKRPLQEIQQEQEFQEWWDNESKRVQEEEQASFAATKGDIGGRGSGEHRTGRGRGGGVASAYGIKGNDDGASRVDNNSRGRSRRRGRRQGQKGESRGD